MRFTLALLIPSVLLTAVWTGSPCLAQFGDDIGNIPAAAKLGERTAQRWKVGMIVSAGKTPCQQLFGTLPIPTDWPEQTVTVVSEDISPSVAAVKYRILNDGVKQMLVTVPRLLPGETAQAIVIVEINRAVTLPPSSTDSLVKPKKLNRSLRQYLAASPYVEIRHKKIKKLAAELRDDELNDWKQIEKYYDYVRANVEFREGELKGALAALESGFGDCEELTSLFIAICRVNDVPARTVWVPGHCYPEFYLVDTEGEGHWYPCQAAGDRAFGEMPDPRPILQKGDNFKVPEKKKRQRYVAEFLKSVGGRPTVSFVREVLPVDG